MQQGDGGGRRQLYPGNERKSSETYRKTLVLEIVKRMAESSVRMRKNQGTGHCGGVGPSKTEKETAHGLRVGNGGASATLGNFCLTVKKNRMMVIHLDQLSPIRKPLRTRGLKERAAGAVEEWTPRKAEPREGR
jgi:hypothetical protein